MMTTASWTRAAQVQLLCELKGFWANDLWDMHHSPVKDLFATQVHSFRQPASKTLSYFVFTARCA
jgi:hypothetical protein